MSRCVAERKYTQEQARRELQQVFIPECNDDGTYSQVGPPGSAPPLPLRAEAPSSEQVLLPWGVDGVSPASSWQRSQP